MAGKGVWERSSSPESVAGAVERESQEFWVVLLTVVVFGWFSEEVFGGRKRKAGYEVSCGVDLDQS
jgi:hypothetical protein